MSAHGIFVTERASELTVPKTADCAIIAVGCAPINQLADPSAVVNKPVLATKSTEAMLKLGYSQDFATFGLCQVMYATSNVAAVGPVVYINVLDPKKHKKAMTAATVDIVGDMATVPQAGVLRDDLTVTVGTGEAAQELLEGLDYTVTYDDQNCLVLNFSKEGAAAEATEVTVTGMMLDPSVVTASDVIGAVDIATGKLTGLEAIRYIKPNLGILGNLIIAPGFSQIPEVGIAMCAKADAINSKFKAIAICDLDTEKAVTPEDGKSVKENSGYTTNRCLPVWPEVKVGSYQLAMSSVVAAYIAYLDAENGGVPYMSPSNHTLGITGTCLHDGTEVVLDQDLAAVLDNNGVMTAFNDDGWRLWGDYTGAAPGEGDPKDLWLCCRRMFDYSENNFMLTFAYLVDQPMTRALLDNIVNTQNQIYGALVSSGKLAYGSASYSAEENPKTNIIAGIVTVSLRMSPWTPAREIDGAFSFDIDKLAEALVA